jgi:hypothetical protein
MKFKLLVCSFILFWSLFTDQIAYDQNCYWSSHAGGTKDDAAGRIVNDQYGNTYVVGNTESSECFFNTDTIGWGSFIAKYDNQGNESWILPIICVTGSLIGELGNISMAIDTLHAQLILAGNFYNTLILPDTNIHGPRNTVFLITLDLQGHVIRIITAGGEGDDQVYGLATDSEGNIFLSGSNDETALFEQDSVAPGGFIARYDYQGNLAWAKHIFRYLPGFPFEGYPYTEVFGDNIITGGNFLYMNGEFRADTIIVDSINLYNMLTYSFIACFDYSGHIVWITPYGSSLSSMLGNQLGIDTSNNLFVTGLYYKHAVFNDDTIYANGDKTDAYLAKYDKNGIFKWVRTTQASGGGYGISVCVSSDQGVYVGGVFSGSANFGDTTLYCLPYNSVNMFLAKYDNYGNNIGAIRYNYGGLLGLSTDRSGNICLAGDFKGTLDIGPNTFTSFGEYDSFVAKCSAITGVEEKSDRHSYDLLIFANPTAGKCTINIPDEFQHEKLLTLSIYDNQGKLIRQVPVEMLEGKIRLNIQAEAKGVYTAMLSNGKKSYSGKIIYQ